MRIRRGALRELTRGTSLRSDDFDLKKEELEDGVTNTRIIFRADPKFFFDITSDDVGTECKVRMSPGQVAEIEPRTVTESQPARADLHDRVRGELQQWIRRLDEDLQARARRRYREEARKEIEDQFGDIEDEETFFTREEGEELLRRLHNLEERMEELIRENAPDRRTADSKVAEMQEDIEYLRDHSNKVNKGAWYRTFAVVLGNWLGDPQNRRLLGEGAQVIAGYITGG